MMKVLCGVYLFAREFGYTPEAGYPKLPPPVFFKQDKLEEFKSQILFLFGQLQDMHDQNSSISAKSAIVKYNTTIPWTKNPQLVLEFLSLGSAINLVTPFLEKYKKAGLYSIEPTLSPEDPNYKEWFPQWYQRNESIMQTTPNGQEPGDD